MKDAFQLTMNWGSVNYSIDLCKGIDLSLPLRDEKKGRGTSAWYVGRPRFEPVEGDGFIGSVAKGGCVNFTNVYFNPHGHGTHTECLGHITPEAESVDEVFRADNGLASLMPCLVHSLNPEYREGDLIIDVSQLPDIAALPPALVIRTLPNNEDKKDRQWDNTNPPYLGPDFTRELVKRGVEHLLIDLPSVDKEVDGGLLLSHRAFFGLPDAPRRRATITEFVYAPEGCVDGLYALNLQVAPFDLDASPSRPILFPLRDSNSKG
jgi:arylformamidase